MNERHTPLPPPGDGRASRADEPALARLWEAIVELGLDEVVQRIGTGILSLALFLVVIWVMSRFYIQGPARLPDVIAFSPILPTATPELIPTPDGLSLASLPAAGISRQALMHTNMPSRPRSEIEQYTVQTGDTIFGIAAQFNLLPQTILWSNFDVLADDPGRLLPGQVLNILPVDGVLYQWREGDGLNAVAKFFSVSPEDIIDWPGNHLNRAALGDLSKPNIPAKTELVIPGGTRPFTAWTAARVVRTDPSAGKSIGAGACSKVVEGAIGSGKFIWPVTDHTISGSGYSPEINYPAVDIGRQAGSPVFAADNGVVVYAGDSSPAYGNLVIIDHGDGWQSLYAHLGAIAVTCGQSLAQGAQIGTVGTSGTPATPYLLFELRSDTQGTVNPLDFLP